MFSRRELPQRFGGGSAKPGTPHPRSPAGKKSKARREAAKARREAKAKPAKTPKKTVAKPAKAKSRPAPDIWDKAAKVAIKRGAKTRGGR